MRQYQQIPTNTGQCQMKFHNSQFSNLGIMSYCTDCSIGYPLYHQMIFLNIMAISIVILQSAVNDPSMRRVSRSNIYSKMAKCIFGYCCVLCMFTHYLVPAFLSTHYSTAGRYLQNLNAQLSELFMKKLGSTLVFDSNRFIHRSKTLFGTIILPPLPVLKLCM